MPIDLTSDNLTLQTLRDGKTLRAPKNFAPSNPTSAFPKATAPIASPKTGQVISFAPPVGVNPSGKGGIPLALLTLAAVQTPVKNQSLTSCNVTVSWTHSADPNFNHVNIWFQGYHGGKNPVLVAGGTTSPLNFICDATNETVVVYGQAVGLNGSSAPLVFALTTHVKLSGVVSAPPAPTISQSLVGTPTGYQFGFNQVILPTGDVEVISNYNVYRGVLNSFAAATLRTTISSNPNLMGSITYSDTVNDATGAAYYYWVTAVNSSGYESTPTPAQSGTVAGSVGSLPPSLSTPFTLVTTSSSVTIKTSPSCFFTRADGTVVTLGQTSNACTGLPTGDTSGNDCFFFPYWRESDQTLQFIKNTDVAIPNITGASFTAASDQYVETTTTGVIPSPFTVEMWVKGTTAGALFDYSAPQVVGSTTASIVQAQITSGGEVQLSIHTVSTWTNLTTSGANILDSTWHHIVITYAAGTGWIYVDGAENNGTGGSNWTNVSMGTIATTTGSWHIGVCAGIAGAPLTSTLYNGFTISHVAIYDAALSQIQAAAHMQAFNNLGETFYLSELTYDSAVSLWKLSETSGTTAADSIGSNTGTYKLSPALNQTSAVTAVLGSPAIAWPYDALLAFQQQFLRNRTPLSSSPLFANTAVTGTGSGGGTGGGSSGGGGRGGGYCFSGNTLIKTQRGDVCISEIVSGDRCLTAKGNWIPVKTLLKHEAEHFILHKMPNYERVTFSHKILRGSEWVNAGFVFPETVEVFEPVYHIIMDSTEPFSEMMSPTTERSFTLSSGIIAHNVQPVK